jgi:hypothetical protein
LTEHIVPEFVLNLLQVNRFGSSHRELQELYCGLLEIGRTKLLHPLANNDETVNCWLLVIPRPAFQRESLLASSPASFTVTLELNQTEAPTWTSTRVLRSRGRQLHHHQTRVHLALLLQGCPGAHYQDDPADPSSLQIGLTYNCQLIPQDAL